MDLQVLSRAGCLNSTKKTWRLAPHDAQAIRRLADGLRISPVLAQVLVNRGLHEPTAAGRFLDAPYKGLHDPALLPGVTEAADRLLRAVADKRRICIYGDYDVDGLTGTAILWQTLQMLGGTVDFHVPHRLEEGYGLNSEALRQIKERGTSIMVTVDCGIASLAEADEARRLGLELIVTDHHELKDRLPNADVLVHPRLPGTSYPFGGLSGSGVAFKLAWALCQRASGDAKVTPQFRDFLVDSVALAALGMVADVVPLVDENRIFVRHGLHRLRNAASVGLKALLAAAGLGERADLSGEDISFALAPRLNAAGRLGCARLVVELLTTTSYEKAAGIARILDQHNEDRKKIERRILTHARELLADYDAAATPAMVLAHADWHAGVIGIVASRLVDLHHRPALLIALNGDGSVGQGSGRSVPGFPLHEALAACAEKLLSHGGHAAAAGFKIRPADIDPFRDLFCDYAGRHFRASPPEKPLLRLDAEVSLSLVTHGFVQALQKLEPFGAGNPRPLFLAGPVQVEGTPKKVGAGERHLSFRIRQEGTTHRAIAFNFGDRADELMSAGGTCCLAFAPGFNDWQGFRSVQLEVRDFQVGPRAQLG